MSFISHLKVNVPLNEITHSVWVPWRRVPCLISSLLWTDLKQKRIFLLSCQHKVLTLHFNIPLGHLFGEIRLGVRDSKVLDRESVACFHWPREGGNLHLCYFWPSTLCCHPACPLTAITLPSGTDLMMSSLQAISQLDLLTPELVPGTH